MSIRIRLSSIRAVLFGFIFLMSGVILLIATHRCSWGIPSQACGFDKSRDGSEITRLHNRHGLNQHLWVNICTSNLDLLCDNPLFPEFPSHRRVINTTRFIWPDRDLDSYAQRIFGYLVPPVSDWYSFAIASDDSSEFWLSRDMSWENSEKAAHVGEKFDDAKWTDDMEFTKYSGQISKGFYLESGKPYYMEILHFQVGNGNHLSVAWKTKEQTNFTLIHSNYLMPYFDDDYGLEELRTHEAKSCENLINRENTFLNRTHVEVTKWREFSDVLPECSNYKTTQKINLVEKHEALEKHFRNTYIYPFIMDTKHIYFRNMFQWVPLELDRIEANEVVATFMGKVHARFGSKFKLISIENVEKKIFMNGSRFLLELQLNDTTTNRLVHISNYVYRQTNSTELCYPTHAQWNRQAPITFVITVKNQGTWVYVFLRNMADIIRKTGDATIRVIIFDYDSVDLDLDHAVRTSGLAEKIKTISKPGKYSRRESFNLAMKLVDDPHSIVMLTDLHLEMTTPLLNEIRKHCIEGEQVYTPLIIRLLKCSSPSNPWGWWIGYWEELGFGITAMYKSDWDKTGGFKFNTKNKHEWGGEDYELIDSVASAGLGYERVGCPYIYHYEHARKGMWE